MGAGPGSLLGAPVTFSIFPTPFQGSFSNGMECSSTGRHASREMGATGKMTPHYPAGMRAVARALILLQIPQALGSFTIPPKPRLNQGGRGHPLHVPRKGNGTPFPDGLHWLFSWQVGYILGRMFWPSCFPPRPFSIRGVVVQPGVHKASLPPRELTPRNLFSARWNTKPQPYVFSSRLPGAGPLSAMADPMGLRLHVSSASHQDPDQAVFI